MSHEAFQPVPNGDKRVNSLRNKRAFFAPFEFVSTIVYVTAKGPCQDLLAARPMKRQTGR